MMLFIHIILAALIKKMIFDPDSFEDSLNIEHGDTEEVQKYMWANVSQVSEMIWRYLSVFSSHGSFLSGGVHPKKLKLLKQKIKETCRKRDFIPHIKPYGAPKYLR